MYGAPVTPQNPREMTSKFAGICKAGCGAPIKEGDEILWLGPGNGSKHKECPYVPETERIVIEDAKRAERASKADYAKPGEYLSDLVVPADLELHYHGSYFAVHTGIADDVVFFRFDRPKEGTSWEGWTFLKLIIGGGDAGGDGRKERLAYQRRDGHVIFYPGMGEAYVSLVADALSNPKEAMQLYGSKVGRCAYCHKLLTDPLSRERGIGPECWKARGFGR